MPRNHLVVSLLVSWMFAAPALAQTGGFGGGGVRIDAEGILRAATSAERRAKPKSADLPEPLASPSDRRRVSLKTIAEQVKQSIDQGEEIPEELLLMAGLSSIDYIIFDEEAEDISIVGSAGGWDVLPEGREVSTSNGRAILHLEDLATALRSIRRGSAEISCSIDPTKAGLAAVQQVSLDNIEGRRDKLKREEAVRDALGRQKVRTAGVPRGSRFARTMVEADYLMKQIAIGGVQVKGLANHLDTVVENNKQGGKPSVLARWWFTSDYEPLTSNPEQTVLRINGPRVKLLNEQMMLTREGNRLGNGSPSGKPDRFSQEFTDQLPDLQTKFPVFSDLRNLYDLVLLAALIDQRGAFSWIEDTVLIDSDAWPTPESVPPIEAEPVATLATDRWTTPEGHRGTLISVAWGGVSMRTAIIEIVPSAQPPLKELKGEPGSEGSAEGEDEPDGAIDGIAVETTEKGDKTDKGEDWWSDLKQSKEEKKAK